MEPLFKSVAKVYQSVLSDGVAGTAFKILHRLRLISVLHGFHFVLIELDSPSLSGDESSANPIMIEGTELEMREIKSEELMQLHFADGMYSIETFQMHFSKGMRFFAAFHKDAVVSVNGINTRTADLVYIKRPDLQLPEGMAYLNCAMTVPDYRNRSIGTEVRSFMLHQLAQEGVRSVFGAIFVENKDALRWNLRNGFKYLGKIYYVRCGHSVYWWKRWTPIGRCYRHIFNGIHRQPDRVMAEVAG